MVSKLPTVLDVARKLESIELPSVPETVVITDNDTYLQAGDLLRQVKSRIKEVEAHKDVFMEPLNELRTALLNSFRPRMKQLQGMENSLKSAIGSYDAFLEERRAIAEAQMRDAFREQTRLAAIEAQRLTDEGKLEEAEAVEVIPYVPAVLADKPKLEGISSRTKYVHEVTDFEALVKAAATGLVPMEYLQPNDKVLAGIASALKDATHIPGVKVYPKSIIASRGV